MNTNDIESKAQRYKAQPFFLTRKSEAQNAQSNFLIFEAQRNFRNELFDSAKAQRNSAIAERHFRTKLKRNLTSAAEVSQHDANPHFLRL